MNNINLIGISGKINSGKDLVGKIIQYLTSDYYLKYNKPFDINYDAYEYYKSNWEIKKFATALKQICSILTGIPMEKFEDQEFKKTFLGDEWSKWRYFRSAYSQNDREWEKITVRELLQKVGTEAMRDNVHPNVWVNALFADYKIDNGDSFMLKLRRGNTQLMVRPPKYPNWIITDLRFPNEYQAIKDRGGICIRVNRPVKAEGNQNAELLHVSEVALNNHTFDYEILNDGSIEKLTEEVKKMLLHFKIIE